MTIGSASYAVSAGQSSTLRLKRQLQRTQPHAQATKSVRVQLSVTPTGGKAATKTLTLRR